MRLSRYVVAPVLVLVVAGLAAGLLTGAFSSAARSGLYAAGLLSDGGASTLPPGALSHPASPRSVDPDPQDEPQGAPPAVLKPATAGPAPRAAKVAAKVDGVNRSVVKPRFSGSVMDVGSGKVLYAEHAKRAYVPASTMKLLTTTAALSILGPQHRFSTRVVSTGSSTITLVGGGDPYLMKSASSAAPDRASLSRLAQLTAAQLKKSTHTKVALHYDVSLFSGPAWNPDWPAKYRDQVTPVSSLWINEGRVAAASGPRVADPAETAARAFAKALTSRGITVTSVSRSRAPDEATPVAMVRSMTLERIVEALLTASDNDAAEVVARQAAIGAGKQGSITAARAVVKARLTKLDIFDDAARLRDGSGLSRSNKVPADMMVKVVRLALEEAHPELRPVVTGMPVAGVEGSLRNRYAESGATAGRGLVRAKTGTLTGVDALVGYVRTADGSMLSFAFLVNDATDYAGTRSWLDRVTSAVSTCGCH